MNKHFFFLTVFCFPLFLAGQAISGEPLPNQDFCILIQRRFVDNFDQSFIDALPGKVILVAGTPIREGNGFRVQIGSQERIEIVE
ncbi:MAG: hypothetical protein H6573_11050 [Lewinellaceae bacterium]|nr:hypothetical protein [Phaeodactylibacter sp.]MCB9348029.1 hypothetical protein [Lewinellaceae bacterium]